MVDSEVLIVGAGPVGLTAAVELVRRGRAVRIVDKAPAPTDLSKAVAVNVQSLELLEPSGLTERLVAAGIHLKQANLSFEGEPLARLDLSATDHRFNFLLALPQNETERVLGERLAELGVTVDRGLTVTGFEETGDGVTARMSREDGGTQEVRSAWLLGCDGARSTVRTTLEIPFVGARYEEEWSLADISVDWPTGFEGIYLGLHRSGEILFTVPIGPGRLRAVSQTPDVLGLLPPEARVTETHWESRFHVALRQAERYQQGRCFLAGDAAHVHSPAGGRGMNLGMWDACSFAARLEAGTLDGYTAERHPIGERILTFTDRLFRVAGLKSRPLQLVRNTLLRNLAPLPAVQRRIAPNLLGIER